MHHTCKLIVAEAVQEAVFFLGSLPRDGTPIKLNGNIAIRNAILKLVPTSTIATELSALCLKIQEARIL